ncbi:ricin-type beta-trefoil lectin domain protein [Micromonospora sp. M12]
MPIGLVVGASPATAAATGAITGYGGKCVDVAAASTANNTPVQLFTCNGSTAQQWTVADDGTIRALGKCLDIAAASTANGARAQIYDCNGTGAQQWSSNAGQLVNPTSGKCLDATGPSSADGTRSSSGAAPAPPTRPGHCPPAAAPAPSSGGFTHPACWSVEVSSTSSGAGCRPARSRGRRPTAR